MNGRTIQLRVAGQDYRVVSSASEEDLQRLAEVVSAKVSELTPRGKAMTSQSVLLAAMALAHELNEERDRRRDVEARARTMMRKVLARIDDALDSSDEVASDT